ncbi:MAG: hypothetical protein Q8Q12_18975 [bacterium]|nr:hypothetical protein [bacterium]
MSESTSLPQLQECLELKAKVMRAVETGGDPDPEDLARLYSLEAVLRRAGINPEEIYAETSGQAVSPFGPRGDASHQNLVRPITRDVLFKRVVEVGGDGYPGHVETIEQTESGLVRLVEEPLILAACGRRIREVGGRCSVCQQFECPDHVFFCHADGCHISLCLRHVHFFPLDGQNIPFCRKHFRRAVHRRNMWDEESKRREQE